MTDYPDFDRREIEEKTCPVCGKPWSDTGKYCMYCGSLKTKAKIRRYHENGLSQLFSTVYGPRPVFYNYVCDRCDYATFFTEKQSALYCPDCGNRLSYLGKTDLKPL